MTIYIRDDDVLLPSSQWSDPVTRFKQIHGWILESPRFLHVPAILVTEIQEFPSSIPFINEETSKGKMRPQLHGFQHIDYAKLSLQETKEHLSKSFDWWKDNFVAKPPTKWYTPWGANGGFIHEAAEEFGLEVVDCSNLNMLEGAHGIISGLRRGMSVDLLEEKEIFFHWWQRGARLWRLTLIGKHGSWAEAKKAHPEIFS